MVCPPCNSIPLCPPCPGGQVCQQSYPNDCETCPANVCVADPSEAPGKLYGVAIGGSLGAAFFCVLLYVLYRRLRRTLPVKPSVDNRVVPIPPMPPMLNETHEAPQDEVPMRPISSPVPELIGAPSSRELWRISEQVEPPEPMRHRLPNMRGAPPSATSSPKPNVTSTQASFARRGPVEGTGQAFGSPNTDVDAARTSAYYAFWNHLVDEYDHPDYESVQTVTLSPRPISSTAVVESPMGTPGNATRVALSKGRVELVQVPSSKRDHPRARPSPQSEVRTPDAVMVDPFSSSVCMEAS